MSVAARGLAQAARLAALAAALAAALVAALAGPGCGRREYQPVRGDSTRAAAPDSFAIRARAAIARWDSGPGEDAARLTGALLLDDLRRRARRDPGAAWKPRAQALLDSLGVGCEIAADRCAMVVNFFSRSDPERGAWPWLYRCGEGTLEGQPVEGAGLRLVSVTARGLPGGPPRPAGPPGVAALFARRAGVGSQPLLYVWGPGSGDAWSLVQTLGADSLGGNGTAEFAVRDTTVVLTARTYRPTPRFDECATCPHVYRVHTLRWTAGGFLREDERSVPSPYATFVRFATAMAVGDAEFALEQVSHPSVMDAARRFQFFQPRGSWRIAPATDESSRSMVFLRGRSEAYRVTFDAVGDDFRIAAIEPESPSFE